MAAPLSTLRAKFARRKHARDRQSALWRKTKKAGHGKAAKRHAKAVRKLRRLIRRRRPKSGTGPWSGTKSIIDREVVPVAKRYGVPTTSRKRAVDDPLTIANPSSDHSAAATDAYAIDFGTWQGAALAYSIAHALGIRPYSTGNDTSHYIERAGRRFRVQILWAVSGHYDHVHVGIRRDG